MTPLLSSTLLRTQSDARLAALASRGHERAFEAIVERYRKPLHRWCRRVLPEARAEDAVQTTFMKAWTSLQDGTEVAELRPWLYRIARNAALDNARKAGYDYEELTGALNPAPGPDDDLERRRVIRETLAGVAGLPENQREALMRTAAGHSRAEIARELELSEGAVRQLVHRARSSLRAAATALTPMPVVSWAAAMGAEAGGPAVQRIAEVAAGAGSAGIASLAIKTGTVIVAAGVLAAGPGSDLRHEVAKDSNAAASSARPASDDGSASGGSANTNTSGEDASGQGRRARGGDDSSSRRRRGRGGGGDDEKSGSSGSGSSGSSGHGGDDSSGDSGERRGSSGSGRSGSGDGGDDHSGSSGSGRSGSGSDDGGSSGSGSGGEDHSGSGSGSGSGGDVSSGSGSGSDGDVSSDSGSSGSGSGDEPETVH